MSQNLRPAFIGHPGVESAPSAQRRATGVHSNVMMEAGMEWRLTYADGTRSPWKPVSRGAMILPPAAVLMEVRRQPKGANDVSR